MSLYRGTEKEKNRSLAYYYAHRAERLAYGAKYRAASKARLENARAGRRPKGRTSKAEKWRRYYAAHRQEVLAYHRNRRRVLALAKALARWEAIGT